LIVLILTYKDADYVFPWRMLSSMVTNHPVVNDKLWMLVSQWTKCEVDINEETKELEGDK